MPILPTLKLYYQGPSVSMLQRQFIGLSYLYNGLQVTGVFDDKTDEVVRDFQAEHKLKADGVVGPVTWTAILNEVVLIQNKLNSLGFNSGSADGWYGPMTTNAVKSFQTSNGLAADGTITPRTREKMFNPNPKDNYRIRPSSSALSALHPYVQKLANNFLALCASSNLKVLIYTTFRSWNDQDVSYAQGRTAPGAIVTDARGGESYHNWGLAFDCAPLDDAGNILWEDTDKYVQLGTLGQQAGLEWGGNWTSYAINLVDMPHFQYTFGLSTNDLLNGKRPPS